MIFVHELGHFLVAKYFKVKVLKFALGFGPKIVAREAGETEYSVRYIPLGGFVKMLGEDEYEEETEELSPDDKKRAFNNQHPLKRIAIVAAGPLFNLVLALFLFCGMFLITGSYIRTPEIVEVIDDSPAYRAGLKEGDVIIAARDNKVESVDDLMEALKDQAGNPMVIAFEREGKVLSVTITPEESLTTNEFGEEVKTAQIGALVGGKYEHIKMGPLEALKGGVLETWKWVKLTCLVVVKLFQGDLSIKTVGGPIMIGQMTGEITKEAPSYLVPFMAVISINLGILNLFPIPILDGGLIVFLLIELVLGRPLSIRKREMAQKIGLSLLLLLVVIVFYNDILRLFQ
jgi:regulator of sigma E protease